MNSTLIRSRDDAEGRGKRSARPFRLRSERWEGSPWIIAGPAERLAAVDRRIGKAKALIVRQEILVARLAATGADGTLAREALEEMRSTLAEMYRHRRLLLRKLLAALERSLALSHQHRELILAEIADTLLPF